MYLLGLLLLAGLWLPTHAIAAVGDPFACTIKGRTPQEAAAMIDGTSAGDRLCYNQEAFAALLNSHHRPPGDGLSAQAWAALIRQGMQVRVRECAAPFDIYYRSGAAARVFTRTQCRPGEQFLEYTPDDPASPDARWRRLLSLDCLNPFPGEPLSSASAAPPPEPPKCGSRTTVMIPSSSYYGIYSGGGSSAAAASGNAAAAAASGGIGTVVSRLQWSQGYSVCND